MIDEQRQTEPDYIAARMVEPDWAGGVEPLQRRLRGMFVELEVALNKSAALRAELNTERQRAEALEHERDALRARVAPLDEGPVCLLADYQAMRDELRQRIADLEREHVSREDREAAIQAALSAERGSVTNCGHYAPDAFGRWLAEARRLLKLEDA